MTSVRIALDTMTPIRRLAVIAGTVVAVFVLLIVGCAAVLRFSGTGRSQHAASHAVARDLASQPAVVVPPKLTATLTPQDQAAISNDVASLTATPDIGGATSESYPSIGQEQRGQPDLYARAFATEILTQDYRRPRNEVLAWVQSEAVASSEPLVVGLVPAELRHKLAVWSVTTTPDGSPTPVVSSVDWAKWAARKAWTTVQIVRVTEPVKWAAAVSAGDLTDPGVTARDVEANVTVHWLDGAHVRTATRSVTIGLTLEGPPSRGGYGFVDAVTYDEVAVN